HRQRRAAGAGPNARHVGRQVGGAEAAAAGTIGADEVGVAPGRAAARATAAILGAPAPQVAPGEAQEHGGAAGLGALALQRVEDFLDRVPLHQRRRLLVVAVVVEPVVIEAVVVLVVVILVVVLVLVVVRAARPAGHAGVRAELPQRRRRQVVGRDLV